MTAHKHAKLIADYAADAAETDKPWERWEFKYDNEEWAPLDRNPSWSEFTQYRRKPQKKAVDLSVLIRSGIDCEFHDTYGDHTNSIGRLSCIKQDPEIAQPYVSEHDLSYDECRPRMNHWYSWQGGECPLPEGLMIESIERDGTDCSGTSLCYIWKHTGRNTDTIAFKVTGLAEGYCWPWELQTN